MIKSLLQKSILSLFSCGLLVSGLHAATTDETCGDLIVGTSQNMSAVYSKCGYSDSSAVYIVEVSDFSGNVIAATQTIANLDQTITPVPIEDFSTKTAKGVCQDTLPSGTETFGYTFDANTEFCGYFLDGNGAMLTIGITTGNADTDPFTATSINYIVPNAAPTLYVSNGTYTENQTSSIGTSSNPDDADGIDDWKGAKLEVQITSGNQAEDKLEFSPSGLLSLSDAEVNYTPNNEGAIKIADINDTSDTSNDGIVTNGDKLTISFVTTPTQTMELEDVLTNGTVGAIINDIKFSTTSENPTALKVISYTLTDANGGSVIYDRNITIAPVNDTPEINSTAITTAVADTLYEYNLTATDVDNMELNWSVNSASTLPSWLSLDSSGVVSTLAGNGSIGSADGNATEASFKYPSGVAIDSSGNIYVADYSNNKIRKITQEGVVTTFAGSGSIGSADGNATEASFKYPSGVAIDSSGNIYVADLGNYKIRKITQEGVVTTFAGSGTSGSADGNATEASFKNPSGVAVDSNDNIYVADQGNHKIRKITQEGVVTTFAGSGTQGSVDGNATEAKFTNPYGVAIDSSDNIYVADKDNYKIRKITQEGVVTTFAGSKYGSADGNATEASFAQPYGVAVDSSDNVYVADLGNAKIRKITPQGVVTTFAGSEYGFADGDATEAKFGNPMGVAIDNSGNIYVADYNNNKIRKIEVAIKLSGTPTIANGAKPTENIALTLSDGTASVDHNFTISVSGLNNPTVISNESNVSVDDNSTINPFANLSITDVEDDNISVTVTMTSNSGGGSFSTSSILSGTVSSVLESLKAITFDPTDNFAKSGETTDVTYTLSINDGYSDTNITSKITINSINDAPVWNIPTQNKSKNINDSILTRYDLSSYISDADVNSTLTILPSSSNSTIATVAMDGDTLVVVPQDGQSGEISVDLNLTDGTEIVTETLTVNIVSETVAPINKPEDLLVDSFADVEKATGTTPNIFNTSEYVEVVTNTNVTYAVFSDADQNGKLSIMKKIGDDSWEYVSGYKGYGNGVATNIKATFNRRSKEIKITYSDEGAVKVLSASKEEL